MPRWFPDQLYQVSTGDSDEQPKLETTGLAGGRGDFDLNWEEDAYGESRVWQMGWMLMEKNGGIFVDTEILAWEKKRMWEEK